MLMITYFFTIILLEVIFIILAKKEKNKKYFKIFNGLFFGFFISIFLYTIYFTSDLYSYDTGSWVELEELFKCIFLCIINIIIGVIGLFIQKSSKKHNSLIDTSKKRATIKYTLLVSIISFVIIFGQFVIKYNGKIKNENEVKKETMAYLKEKYGSNDFKIIDIDRDFGENGFIGTDHLEKYDISAIYVPDNIKFYIKLDVDNARKIQKGSSSDNLTLKYYEIYFKNDDFLTDVNNEKNKLIEYLKAKQFNIEIEFSKFFDLIAYNGLPNDYGKIPSKEELYNFILDYCIKHNFQITINKDEIKSEDVEVELKSYLINLSRYIIEYYNDLNNYEIICKYNGGQNKYFRGTINIDEEYININVGSIKDKIKRK